MRVPRPLTKTSITNNQPSTQTKQAFKIIKHTTKKAGESAEVLNAADYFELDAGVDAVANVQAGNDADKTIKKKGRRCRRGCRRGLVRPRRARADEPEVGA